MQREIQILPQVFIGFYNSNNHFSLILYQHVRAYHLRFNYIALFHPFLMENIHIPSSFHLASSSKMTLLFLNDMEGHDANQIIPFNNTMQGNSLFDDPQFGHSIT